MQDLIPEIDVFLGLSAISNILQDLKRITDKKKKFAEMLSQATNTDPIYEGDGESEENANQLVNNTSQKQSDGQESGGKTAVGVEVSESGDAKVSSTLDGSQGSSGSSGYLFPPSKDENFLLSIASLSSSLTYLSV